MESSAPKKGKSKLPIRINKSRKYTHPNQNHELLYLAQQQQGWAITSKSVEKRRESARTRGRKAETKSSFGGGEIVHVQGGGHIIRSNGRKDRHSKVYTAKGPRDRRVRLSAHTAIQFYDVQDRLGVDRPSKAVDWLISKAKESIDKLSELPLLNNPNYTSIVQDQSSIQVSSIQQPDSSSAAAAVAAFASIQPSSVDTQQSIAETMTISLPTNSGNSSMNFHSFPHDIIMSRATSIQGQDLCLSLPSSTDQRHAVFSSSDPSIFDANYARMVGWSVGGDGDGRIGLIFNSISMPPQTLPEGQTHPLLCQSAEFPQSESLQSGFSHLLRAWNDIPLQQSSISSNHFASELQLPAQIHSEEYRQVVFNKSSSAAHH